MRGVSASRRLGCLVVEWSPRRWLQAGREGRWLDRERSGPSGAHGSYLSAGREARGFSPLCASRPTRRTQPECQTEQGPGAGGCLLATFLLGGRTHPGGPWLPCSRTLFWGVGAGGPRCAKPPGRVRLVRKFTPAVPADPRTEGLLLVVVKNGFGSVWAEPRLLEGNGQRRTCTPRLRPARPRPCLPTKAAWSVGSCHSAGPQFRASFWRLYPRTSPQRMFQETAS